MTGVIIPDPPACFPPSKERNNAILDALDVEHKWLPTPDGKTRCNIATKAACTALSVHLPDGLLANAYQTWLASDAGRRAGWMECNSGLARLRSEHGLTTLPTLHEEPHGHICVARGINEAGELMVWSAGRHNFNCVHLRSVFTAEQVPHLRYFTHD